MAPQVRKPAAGAPAAEARELRNYRLLERVSQEELATVYQASHLTLDRPVLVHILRRTDWVSSSRFQLAARLAARLSHPNLLPVIDAGHDDHFGHYMVTPAMNARTLEQCITDGPLPPALAVRVAQQIGAAIDHLHSQQVVHRDIQPAHVLLTEQGVAYLANLSLAASPETPDLSSVDEADYLTHYSAPEQSIASAAATPALDIYGLGAVLYSMLTGQPPPGTGEPLPSVAMQNPALASADRVIQRMMAADPAQRYSSCAQAVTALRLALRALLDQATDDMQESRWEPIAEWLENPTETALGRLLNPDYLSRSRARADGLHRADAIGRALDRWSRKGSMRRRLLGRLIQPEQIVSYNLYFFDLKVLFETRTRPAQHEQPLVGAHTFPAGPEPDVWDAPVPETAPFEPVAAREIPLPNSEHVRTCPDCLGSSEVVCTTCNGKGALERTRKVRSAEGVEGSETIQETCQACHGYRRQRCKRCNGNGNLLEAKRFTWSRRGKEFQNTDDLEGLPRFALEPRLEEVFHGPIDPWEGRWHSVAPLHEMLEQAVSGLDDDTHLVAAELRIRGIPVTEVDYNLRDRQHRLALLGFDNTVRGDLSLIDTERLMLIVALATLAILILGMVLWNILR